MYISNPEHYTQMMALLFQNSQALDFTHASYISLLFFNRTTYLPPNARKPHQNIFSQRQPETRFGFLLARPHFSPH